MAQLSKTAKASLRVGVTGSRVPKAWLFKRNPGKLQTRPFFTSYVDGEAEAIQAENPELILIKFEGKK